MCILTCFCHSASACAPVLVSCTQYQGLFTAHKLNWSLNQWRRHGVDMSTPLLLEVAPNPTSFYRGRGRGVALPPDPRYRLALRARYVCPLHIFWPGDAHGLNTCFPLELFSAHELNEHKKLSYCQVTARCVLSVVILPVATQQCRNHLYGKSWPNWWYEVGGLVGGNVSWTMCTQPWRERVGSHCLKCHEQTDDVRIVYITCIPTTCCTTCCGEIF